MSTFVGPHLPTQVGLTRVLLVEDDEGDALLVQELIAETSSAIELRRARSVAEALRILAAGDIACVLLDLGLPDADGLSALRRVVEGTLGLAVIVLTGHADEHRGIEALASGAQDYLVKGQVDGALLTRAIRYAIERRRAEESLRRLYESELRAAENARLERGLLPLPLTHGDGLDFVSRYRPGRHQALLGGDFFDLVECEDGTVLMIIGDVSGHGPDEAALGVGLRIGWRTLVLAGHDRDRILPDLQQVLHGERRSEESFATVCMVAVDPARQCARVWLAGHPAPLHLHAAGVESVPGDRSGPALGIVDDATWDSVAVPIGPTSGLLLFTDGLIEGHIGRGSDRLGDEGLIELIEALRPTHPDTAGLIDNLLAQVRALNGGELADDVAVLSVGWSGTAQPSQGGL
jgi:serine phosphatase RsbU (regulator of sigma subunit)